MALEQQLLQKKAAILERWLALTLDSYPADTTNFLKQEKDRFLNPVGHTISLELETLFNELLRAMNPEKLAASLDSIIRIRTVQDFTPSQATAFIFLLKKAVRDELVNEALKPDNLDELSELESRIDNLALIAFDIYMQCRDKVNELKVSEIKAHRDRVCRLLERTIPHYTKAENGLTQKEATE